MKPRVLVYVSLPATGEVRGGPRSMLLVAKHFAKYDPFFVLNGPSSFEDEVDRAGLECRVLSGAPAGGLRSIRSPGQAVRRGVRAVAFQRRMLALAKEREAVLLHCQQIDEALLLGPALGVTGLPMIMQVRDASRGVRTRKTFLAGAAMAARTVFNSQPLLESYVRGAPLGSRGWLRARSAAVSTGIELERFAALRASSSRDKAREALGMPPGAFVVTTIGPLSHKKNQLALLNAAPALLAADDAVVLCFVGSDRAEPDYAARCRALAAGLPADRVRFVSELPHDGMFDLYAASDVVAIPSTREGLPRVALEAQALGLPIIGSRIPGNEGAIVEGETGFLAPLDRLDELAAHVRSLRDPERWARASRAAIAHAESSFDVRKNAARLELLYDDVLAERRYSRSSTSQ